MPYFEKRFQTPLNILIVDDSAIIRRVLQNTLSRHNDINVVAACENGQLALEAVKNHASIDMVLMDIEMPVMDGMTALPLILEVRPKLKVMIISTLSKPNATVTMEALRLGAVDYLPKPTAQETHDLSNFERDLLNKIRANFINDRVLLQDPLAASRAALSSASSTPKPSVTPEAVRPVITGSIYPSFPVHALAIGSSTGGPQALQTLFSAIAGQLKEWPIFITQHMPATFTGILAEQLSQTLGRKCIEAVHDGLVQPGGVYVAPGDYHMEVALQGGNLVTKINQNPQVNYCRPSVDAMMPSLIKFYGKNLLGVMLTGMGQDGMQGFKAMVQTGGTAIAQDKETSVVWGMPKAVAEAGICRQILPLQEIGSYLISVSRGAR